MKKLFITLVTALTLLGCVEKQQEDSGIVLNGTIISPDPEALVLLEEYGDKDITVIDTIMVEPSGIFTHHITLSEPGFYRLNLYNKQSVNLILYEDDLEIQVAGDAPDGMVNVTGSKDMEYLMAANKLVQDFQSSVRSLNEQFNEASAQNDQTEMQRIRDQYELENQEHKKLLKQKVKEMGNSLAVLQVLGSFNPDEDSEFLNEIGNTFAANPPDSKHTQALLSYIESLQVQAKRGEQLGIGKTAPEINLPNPEGQVVPLSSLRGKVVLVDFWAQWCKPCRMENPNIVAAYNEYKERGFEVYGVSLDRSKDKWLQGIEEDGLGWTHVSDLKYWQSEAAKTYNINAIPASFLLDREGKIIAKNLRGQSLHQKLKEILG